MHVPPQWVNKHLIPQLIYSKQGEPKMTPHLAAMIKRVTEICDAVLQACHCVKEFTLRWIRPFGRQDNLVYECSWQADPNHEPADSKIFNSIYCS
jgi:hypothetical protein